METKTKSQSGQNIPSARARCCEAMAPADRCRLDDHGQTLRKGPDPSGRLGSRKGEAPSASKLSSEKFFAKTTFMPFDCVDNGIRTTSERDLERQGRSSRGTPTPPGYGYLTRHLP
jgi:hypothetical protein